MFEENISIDLTSCRICLTNKKPLSPLFKYKLSGNYAEMLTAIADVKVSSNDGLPEKICPKCCTALEKAYLLKSVAERSDKKLRMLLAKASEHVPTKKILFDSFTDIKSEIGPLAVKNEPSWEMEIDVLDTNALKPIETLEGKDIVIANTVIRKVDGTIDEMKNDTSQNNDIELDYLDDDIFHDDDDDDDYMPPVEKTRTKFKKPKLSDIKVFKPKKTTIVKKILLKSTMKDLEVENAPVSSKDGKIRSTTITCYPLLKNGTRGPPILLKRPKDATVLKLHQGYKSRSATYSSDSSKHRNDPSKSIRLVRSPKAFTKREKLVCPVCGILTYTLGNHMATHDEKKKFTCTHCPKTFIQKSNLMLHMKQHTGIKDHICEICGAGFYTHKSLARHNLIHKGERPFSCNLCSKKFIARCDLNRHLRIHAGYKPYKCGTCTMSFNAKHQLQNHERMHTGERPYSCQGTSLRRHISSHTQERRFACRFCEKRFIQDHHLKNHMLIHTGEKPFSCEVCNFAFSYKVNLNNHVMKVHGINLKFKSIHTVTEEVLQRELGLSNEARDAIAHIMPQLADVPVPVPAPAAHETVHNTEYDV